MKLPKILVAVFGIVFGAAVFLFIAAVFYAATMIVLRILEVAP